MKTIVIVEGPAPKWDRAFSCFSEMRAESLALWLRGLGLPARTITIDEFHKEGQYDKREEAPAEATQESSPTPD